MTLHTEMIGEVVEIGNVGILQVGRENGPGIGYANADHATGNQHA
jgi:hypothetical protein